MKNLKEDLKKTIDLGDSDLENILSKFQPKSFRKNEKMTSFGKISKYFKFIDSGLLRVYFIDKQAKEITIQIGIENMWIGDIHSFLTQTPSLYHIDILEDTTILQIHKTDLETLFLQVPIMERFFGLKVQRAYISLQERTLHQLNKSAEERYLEFKRKYNHIESRVPQYMIASYLNISPEHLSKVRHFLAKK
ncbi:Crp/Fnr family transcriptional regulator [Flavivirga spongiicola]|uniref:Crp/Fnr family transcriptional regulator n=1 Tax=Flavivirga spongiicola TaxID=421621 RepID=A0ABU7XQC0_9FLAO|nr:Crp/Fnr family transcriptional regulator [Flavivirga sp. MEBiC05379]MDO5977975.1 Crp/Fnr family transcriptional regulator [Flavivirga sp. MEBiC05379]